MLPVFRSMRPGRCPSPTTGSWVRRPASRLMHKTMSGWSSAPEASPTTRRPRRSIRRPANAAYRLRRSWSSTRRESWCGPGAGPGEGYNWPQNEHGVSIDPKGFVWIGGNGEKDGQYLKFTRDGKFVLQIGKQGDQTDSNDVTRLGKPADAEVDPETNEVYIADGYFNHRVIVFDADSGAYKRHWGAYGKKPTDEKLEPYNSASSQFGNPVHCVKIAKDGLVYVCDRANNRLQVFRKDGSFVKEFAYEKNTRASGSVWDLDFWIDGKQTFLFNADGTNNEVRTLVRESGEVVGAFGRNGRNAGEFHWVHNLAIDSKGNLYTTEVDTGKRAQKFRYVGPAVAK